MNLQTVNLSTFIEEYLSWELSGLTDDISAGSLAEELAYRLKNNGYCSEPYSEFERALSCPINKRNEKYCNCTHCKSHKFCNLLRKEGYINVSND